MSQENASISVTIPVPQKASAHGIKEAQSKLAYVNESIDSVSIDKNSNLVLHLKSDADESLITYLKDKVRSVFIELFDQGFEPEIVVIEDHSRARFHFSEDPLPILIQERHLVPEGKGYFAFGPMLANLVDAVEEKIKKIAFEMEAQSYRFPALISPAYLEKVKYFRNFPHSLCFVTHLREDIDVIRKFSEHASTDKGEVMAEGNAFSKVQAMLSPTVCHHLYLMLADSIVPGAGMTATAFGNCFRYESVNMISLERLWNFSMREIIFVGTPDYIDDGLQRTQNCITGLLRELGIAYTVETATDPFFVGNYRDYAAYQTAFQLKQEVRAQLPYKNDSIAIGSYNRHQDFFGQTLGIRLNSGDYVNTGCVGFGFERLVLSFVAQHGVNFKDWPRSVKKMLA